MTISKSTCRDQHPVDQLPLLSARENQLMSKGKDQQLMNDGNRN